MTHIIYFKGTPLNIIGAIQITVPDTEKIRSDEIEIRAVIKNKSKYSKFGFKWNKSKLDK